MNELKEPDIFQAFSMKPKCRTSSFGGQYINISINFVELLTLSCSDIFSLISFPNYNIPLCNRPQLRLCQLRPSPFFLMCHVINEILLDLDVWKAILYF